MKATKKPFKVGEIVVVSKTYDYGAMGGTPMKVTAIRKDSGYSSGYRVSAQRTHDCKCTECGNVLRYGLDELRDMDSDHFTKAGAP